MSENNLSKLSRRGFSQISSWKKEISKGQLLPSNKTIDESSSEEVQSFIENVSLKSNYNFLFSVVRGLKPEFKRVINSKMDAWYLSQILFFPYEQVALKKKIDSIHMRYNGEVLKINMCGNKNIEIKPEGNYVFSVGEQDVTTFLSKPIQLGAKITISLQKENSELVLKIEDIVNKTILLQKGEQAILEGVKFEKKQVNWMANQNTFNLLFGEDKIIKVSSQQGESIEFFGNDKISLVCDKAGEVLAYQKIKENTKFVVSAYDDYAQIRLYQGQKKIKNIELQSEEEYGVLAPAQLVTYRCRCGTMQCEKHHRLESWDETKDPGNFIINALKGPLTKTNKVQCKTFKQGMHYQFLREFGFGTLESSDLNGLTLRKASVLVKQCTSEECINEFKGKECRVCEQKNNFQYKIKDYLILERDNIYPFYDMDWGSKCSFPNNPKKCTKKTKECKKNTCKCRCGNLFFISGKEIQSNIVTLSETEKRKYEQTCKNFWKKTANISSGQTTNIYEERKFYFDCAKQLSKILKNDESFSWCPACQKGKLPSRMTKVFTLLETCQEEYKEYEDYAKEGTEENV